MPVGLQLLPLLFLPALLDEVAQVAHFLVPELIELEVVHFSKAELAIIIVQTLLGDCQHFGSLLKVDFLFGVVGLRAIQMQISPLFD